MKPVYQNFIEKGMQEMAVRAAEATLTGNSTSAGEASIPNGKLHRS